MGEMEELSKEERLAIREVADEIVLDVLLPCDCKVVIEPCRTHRHLGEDDLLLKAAVKVLLYQLAKSRLRL